MNPWRVASHDGISGAVIKACADQLAGKKTVSTSLKAFTIISKKTGIDSLDDYRPIALMSLVMEYLEQIVSQHLRDCLPSSPNPQQFAYRANRWRMPLPSDSSDSYLMVMAHHRALSYLESRKNYVRMLFVDYSSDFKIIIPPSSPSNWAAFRSHTLLWDQNEDATLK